MNYNSNSPREFAKIYYFRERPSLKLNYERRRGVLLFLEGRKDWLILCASVEEDQMRLDNTYNVIICI